MAKMNAVDAAVLVLEREGVTVAFGVPGAAINPLLRGAAQARLHPPHPGAPRRGRFAHGRRLYARQARQHRRLHRHLRPGRHRHDHRPLRRRRGFDSDPVHHRPGAARAGSTRRTSRRSTSSRSPSRSPNGRSPCASRRWCRCVFQQAFHVMRSGRPGPVLIDLPIDVQTGGDRIRHRHLRAAAGLQARGDAARRSTRALEMLNASRAAADRRGRRRSSTPTRATSSSSSPN